MEKRRGIGMKMIIAACSLLLVGAIAVISPSEVWSEKKTITPGLAAPKPKPGRMYEGLADFPVKPMPPNIPELRKRHENLNRSGNSMPVLTPDPTIDYKLLVIKPNPDIDYKMQVIRPGWNMYGKTITLPPKVDEPSEKIPKSAPRR